MKYLNNFSLFESIENKLETLRFVGPRDYFDIYEIAAIDNNDDIIGYSHYIGVDDESWLSDLLSVKKDYRNNDYPQLALILRLLTHAVTERIVAKSKDYSASGEGFMRKYEKLGYWVFDIGSKKATLTEKGVQTAEEYAKKYMDMQEVDWIGEIV